MPALLVYPPALLVLLEVVAFRLPPFMRDEAWFFLTAILFAVILIEAYNLYRLRMRIKAHNELFAHMGLDVVQGEWDLDRLQAFTQGVFVLKHRRDAATRKPAPPSPSNPVPVARVAKSQG